MEFAKNLQDGDKHDIMATGVNTFLYALGPDNDMGYHGTNKGPFSLDFAEQSTPSGKLFR